MSAREPLIMYLGALFATAAAIGLAIQGALPQALILAAGAAGLVVWARHEQAQKGDK